MMLVIKDFFVLSRQRRNDRCSIMNGTPSSKALVEFVTLHKRERLQESLLPLLLNNSHRTAFPEDNSVHIANLRISAMSWLD